MNDTKLPAPMAEFTRQFLQREEMMKRALPKGVTFEHFQSIVVQAVMRNRKLLDCDRGSLIQAAFDCANAGLVPDNREAAMVEYFDYGKRKVQFQWMVAGVRKLARNSGLVRNWEVFAVGANDAFRYSLGDYPSIDHEPNLDDPGPLRAVYSIVTLGSGRLTDISREVMSREACERIRNRSQAYRAFVAGKIKTTPWETDFDEMCKKTVAKRHAKRLPLSRELVDVIDRDDGLFDAELIDETPRRRGRKVPPPPTADDEDPGMAADDEYADATQDDGDEGNLDPQGTEDNPRADFEAGLAAARAGETECMDADILNNSDRLNRWTAGWKSAAKTPEGEGHGRV